MTKKKNCCCNIKNTEIHKKSTKNTAKYKINKTKKSNRPIKNKQKKKPMEW